MLIFSWMTIAPLFHPGFFPMHDDTQVVRVQQMAQALKDLQFPVRWVSDLGYGYGYPIFNFYAPLPYYVGGIFNLLGFDALFSTKIMFLLGILFSGVFMYFLAHEFFGKPGGILAGLFYLYAPYHAIDIYVRGAVGEFWAMAFLPLMIWGFYKVGKYSIEKSNSQLKDKNKVWKWIIICALGYAGVILSHNLTAMMATPFLATGLLICFVWLMSERRFLAMRYLLYAFILGLGLSAFFWLPAIYEMKFTNISSQVGGGANFRDHFACLSQLWDSPWGFGGSAPDCLNDGFSFKVGKLHLILSVIAFLLVLFWWGRKRKTSLIILPAVFYLGFSIFMMTSASTFIWESIKPMVYIQYPWRFLVFIIFASSFLAGSIFIFIKNRLILITVFLLSSMILLFYNSKYFQPSQYLDLKADDYINEENIKWKTSKISDEFLTKGFPKPKNPNDIIREKIISTDKTAKLSNLEIRSNKYKFEVDGENGDLILVKVALFPGWKVLVDGKEKHFMYKSGQIILAVPPGKHKVEVAFKNTLPRIVGNVLSGLSILILVGRLYYVRKKVKS